MHACRANIAVCVCRVCPSVFSDVLSNKRVHEGTKRLRPKFHYSDIFVKRDYSRRLQWRKVVGAAFPRGCASVCVYRLNIKKHVLSDVQTHVRRMRFDRMRS